uniref:Uncharacterized protein n=1 Tax=Anguilla anguilla TaxID=7936 RepID=A0A0E9Q6D2_ANGAN
MGPTLVGRVSVKLSNFNVPVVGPCSGSSR